MLIETTHIMCGRKVIYNVQKTAIITHISSTTQWSGFYFDASFIIVAKEELQYVIINNYGSDRHRQKLK